jgi:DNA-binding transcriptional regulator/RsmH inhibitor MraZ
MNIPAGFRKQLTGLQGDFNVYITLNAIESHSYLCILTQEYFQALSSGPAEASGGPFSPNPLKMREFLSIMKEAQDCRYDEHGRLILPKKFLEKAGIRGQVLIVGAREYIQIWDPAAFELYLSGSDLNGSDTQAAPAESPAAGPAAG